jgi:hypothetical protein
MDFYLISMKQLIILSILFFVNNTFSKCYVVKSGDTLSQIAEKVNSKYVLGNNQYKTGLLAGLNGKSNPDKLEVGERICFKAIAKVFKKNKPSKVQASQRRRKWRAFGGVGYGTTDYTLTRSGTTGVVTETGGPIYSLGVQREIFTRYSIGAQYLSNSTSLLILGVDF